MPKFTMPDGEIVDKKDWPQWKTPFNHDTNFESDRTALYCTEPSATKQEFKDETDINVILARFTRTGEPPPMPLPEHFLDTTERESYFQASQRLAEANANFYLLPAKLRTEYLNDPARWADAVIGALDQGNRDELARLGIDVPEPSQEPQAATPAGEASPAPGAAGAASGAPTQGGT